MIRVELPKITLHLLFFVSTDLWMFRASAVLFLFNFFFFDFDFFFLVKYIFNCFEDFFVSTFFCELVIRVEKQITWFAFTQSAVPYLSALFYPDQPHIQIEAWIKSHSHIKACVVFICLWSGIGQCEHAWVWTQWQPVRGINYKSVANFVT